jgi:hypothetical protein
VHGIVLSQLWLHHLALIHLLALARRIELLLLSRHLLLLLRTTDAHGSLLSRFRVNLRLVGSVHVHTSARRVASQVTSAAADISRARFIVAGARLMMLLLVLRVHLTSHAATVDVLGVHLLASLSRWEVLLSASAVKEQVIGYELLLGHESGIFCRLHLLKLYYYS